MNVKNQLLVRVYLVGFFCVLVAVGILWKVGKIHLFEGEHWLKQRDRNYVRVHEIEAERGDILSADGQPLATSLTFFDIFMDPSNHLISDYDFENNVDSLAYCLSKFLGGSRSKAGFVKLLRKKREKGSRFVKIAKSVSMSDIGRVRNFPLFRLKRFKGGYIEKRKTVRSFPFGGIAKRTLGYVSEGKDSTYVGIEGYFNEELRGAEGVTIERKIVPNMWVPISDFEDIQPKKGESLLTTIDLDLQDMVHKELKSALHREQARAGCAVLMDVATGDIVAITNLTKHGQDYYESYNYAVGAALEPGSTFKAASMMALLEGNSINLLDSIDLEGGKAQFSDREMRDAKQHGRRLTSIEDAFCMSSNVGIAKLVKDNFYNRESEFIALLAKAGIGSQTGIEIFGEGNPKLKSPKKKDQWSGTTLPWMSIGYEVTLTPLQLLTFYNGIANNGKLAKPRIIQERRTEDGEVNKYGTKISSKPMASLRTIEQLQGLLKRVVEKGSARAIKSNLLDLSGKTGTAIISYNDDMKGKKYMSSFAGYFPADKPKYSCVVAVYEPNNGKYYGSRVAAPVFKEIAEHTFQMKPKMRKADAFVSIGKAPYYNSGYTSELSHIMTELGIEYKAETNSTWAISMPDENSLPVLERRNIVQAQVPNVIGMGLRDAIYLLESAGMKVKIVGQGKVVSQSQKAGSKPKEKDIIIRLS